MAVLEGKLLLVLIPLMLVLLPLMLLMRLKDFTMNDFCSQKQMEKLIGAGDCLLPLRGHCSGGCTAGGGGSGCHRCPQFWQAEQRVREKQGARWRSENRVQEGWEH